VDTQRLLVEAGPGDAATKTRGRLHVKWATGETGPGSLPAVFPVDLEGPAASTLAVSSLDL